MTLESSSSTSAYKMTSDNNLSDFLWQTPLIYNCEFNEAAKQDILLRCYLSLWMNDDNIRNKYFFSSKQDLQESLLFQSRRHDGKERNMVLDPKSWHANAVLPNQDLTSQKGRQCGRVFRKGEPVYRCRNCGLDDTCVFCSQCFRATDHDGHDIIFSVSPGSGGCCDCGDPEAWKVPLKCKVHTLETNKDTASSDSSSIDPVLIDSIRKSIVSVLNFLLDTFALAPDEVALNSSTEDLVRENQEQRNILSRMGIPSQLADSQMESFNSLEEDVDMDKENSDFPSRSAKGMASSSLHDAKEDDGELYACIAWNDEAHAFSHVLESIITATGWESEKAKQIVDVIHVHGREIIAVDKDISKLRQIAAPLSAISLGVTIRPAKETFREQVCGLLVDWLNEIVNGRKRFFNDFADGDSIIRNIVCEELCSSWELRLPLALLTTGVRTSKFGNDDGDEDDGDMKDDMLMTNSENAEDIEMFEPESDTHSTSKADSPESCSSPLIYRNQCDIASIDWDPAAMVREYHQLRNTEIAFGESLTTSGSRNSNALGKKPIAVDTKETAVLAKNIQREFEDKLRLDYFMLYDLKLWKEVRISLRELYIASLASNPKYKKILGKRLARNYARLAESFLLRDREPENSIILFSVQLLTVPTVSDLLVHDYYFFGLICSTLTAFFLTDRLYLLLPSERSRLPTRINCESRAFRTRRYFNAFHDLRYIMNVDMIKCVLAQNPLYLRQYLDLISLFQCMNAQICQKDAHVEYESEIWVNAFNVTLQIAKCCRQFSDCFGMLPSNSPEDKVIAAATVVKALNKVLKNIMDWGQVDEEEEALEQAKRQAANPGATPPQKIYGALSQTFHTVHLNYTEPFEVVQYNVASQPVSFHHPLHWLLAGLLEYAYLLNDDVLLQNGWEGGFKKVITMFNDTKSPPTSILLSILDFPVRTIVFSSQIRAGVWVRNGFGIRSQAHHYRDISLRENTYDADVFLLQLGFVTIPPDHFLATLLDRFDLVSWFLGKKAHETYDASQTVFMVEEILNLLIVVACERANISGMSLLDKIRREIIHTLCLGSSAYSEITKRIPERITEHPEFDRILSSVTNFKSPEGVNDHGSYELREEFFSETDTYFWHFSRNNREEAESVLRNRWKKANPDKKEEEFFILPRKISIASGPFKHLCSFLQSPVFVQMLAFAIWNVYTGDNHKSDTILDQALYLVLLALTDDNSEDVSNYGQGKFYDYVCSLKFTMELPAEGQEAQQCSMSLFDILSTLYADEKYSEIKARFDYIFEQLENKGVANTRTQLATWRQQYAAQLKENSEKHEPTELSDLEKKKLAAKERQKKIMAQFAQAQSQFMEKNELLYEEEEDAFIDAADDVGNNSSEDTDAGGIHQFRPYPTGTCIVCQEDANERSLPYGLLGLIQTSNIMRETPLDDSGFLNDMYRMGPNLDVEWQDQQCLSDDASEVSGFPAHLHKTGLYASSCGHFMHIKCFEVYCTSIDSKHSTQLTRNHPENRSRKEFMCPLCKSLGNILLPVFWKGKKESYPGVLAKNSEENFADFYNTEMSQIVHNLKQSVISGARYMQNLGSNSGRFKEAMKQRLPNFATLAGSVTNATPIPNTNTAGTREWATEFPTRFPLNETLDNLENAELQQTIEDATVAENQGAETALMETTDETILPGGVLGPFDDDIVNSTALSYSSLLKKSYQDLEDVLAIIYKEICTDESERQMSSAAEYVDMIWGVMGYTIAGVEIASRGSSRSMSVDDTVTNTLFDQISTQAQTLLRILSDTILAYTTIMCPWTGDAITSPPGLPMARVSLFALGRMRQMFDITVDEVATLPAGAQKLMLYDNAPILEDDPFMILTEVSLHLVPMTGADIFPFIRVLLLAEFAKTVTGLVQDRLTRSMEEQTHVPTPSEPSQDMNAAKVFAFSVMNKLGFTAEEAQRSFQKFNSEASFCALLKFFALPFLRRTLILLIIRFGLIVPPTNMEYAQDEFDRLLNILQLPSFADILQPTPITESLLNHWCSQHVRESERRIQIQEGISSSISASRLVNISLNLPTPIYLVALPKQLDRLFDESMKRVCQKCGTVPSDPALCLFCGTLVCFQSFCCAEDEEGECNLHTLECGGEVGVFLSIKKCSLILLHNGNGWFMNTPYLDSHGEVDQGLRHGKPQYLNAKRYSEIRKLWLQHNIPIYVARQIEANHDVGGWTTL